MDLRCGISLSPWTHEVKSHYIILRYALGNSSAAYGVCVVLPCYALAVGWC